MTLDEAIKHCEEKAKELRVEAEEARDIGEYTSSPKHPYNVPVKNCLECAEEHEQLAEWLKELKARREAENLCNNCKLADNCIASLKGLTGCKTTKCFRYEWAKKEAENE